MRYFLSLLLCISALAQTQMFISSKHPSITPNNATNLFRISPVLSGKTAVGSFPEATESIGPYRYYCTISSFKDPVKVSGFKASFNMAPEDLAGIEEGYPLKDKNGWPYRVLNTGTNSYRCYRLLNEINGPITITVTSE